MVVNPKLYYLVPITIKPTGTSSLEQFQEDSYSNTREPFEGCRRLRGRRERCRRGGSQVVSTREEPLPSSRRSGSSYWDGLVGGKSWVRVGTALYSFPQSGMSWCPPSPRGFLEGSRPATVCPINVEDHRGIADGDRDRPSSVPLQSTQDSLP